jgi:hypothetical protein
MENGCPGICESFKRGAILSLLEELSGYNSVFFDTAPIIYYIEAHEEYGPLMKDMLNIKLDV